MQLWGKQRHLLICGRSVQPSIKQRRQHAVRDGARVPKLELRAACGALLRRDGEWRVDLPALERRRIIGRPQGRYIQV